MDAALNPVAAVRLTVQKDSAVWAIVSEVSHSSTLTSHLSVTVITLALHYFIKLSKIKFSILAQFYVFWGI